MHALAQQVNRVATAVLNGEREADESIRVYAALVRTTVQAMSGVVTVARLEKRLPDLTLGREDEE